MPMEPVVFDGGGDHGADAAAVALGVDEGEAGETAGMGGDDTGDFAIGERVIGVESGEDHGSLDTPRRRRAAGVRRAARRYPRARRGRHPGRRGSGNR
jgi:hypothetical protein